jgi:hypothetical protein
MVMLQSFPVYENLVALCMHGFHHHSVPLWALTKNGDLCGISFLIYVTKYVEPLSGDSFTTQYIDYIFNDDYFLAFGGDYRYHLEYQEINWDDKSIISSDPLI